MKKIATLVFLFSISKTILSQTGPDQIPLKLYKAMFDPPTYRANLIQCASTTSTTCNNVNNNTFTPSSSYDPTFPDHFQDPFEAPPGFLVPEWAATHGTPQITDNFNTAPPTLPSGTTGYAFMVTSPSADPLEPSRHEGITQKITPLTAGKKYILSFFSRVQNFTNNNHYLEEFNIKLMNCNDVSNITQPAFPRSFNIPNFDAYPHQNLICQTSNINTTWQQYTTTFTATANFDAIVMYPRNTIVSPFSNFIGVLLAYPQLFEVSNFTAGPIPNPTPGNCTVTIGPTTPNCSVANAVYTWTSPNGTPFPANALQQIKVDAGILQNVGTWKLSMTVPNALIPNGTCTLTQTPVSATVTVPPCGIWPKAYGSVEESLVLVKDHYGNPILYASELSFAPNSYYNHIGVFPNVSPITCTQYTGNGITNWLNANLSPGFAFNSGAVQLHDDISGSNIFVDGNTGNSVTTPINLAADEFVLAETNTGTFITMTSTNQGYSTLYVRTSANTISSTYIGTNSYSGKFNPITNNILVFSSPNSVIIYHFDGTNINYVSTSVIPLSPPYNQLANLALVDNQDRIYFLENNVLKYFDYQTGPPSTVIIPGFNNNNLQLIANLDPYTGNRCLVYNMIDNYLYYIDVNSLTSKKVLCTGMGYNLQGIFNNNDVFLTGKYHNQFQIGSQSIPSLPAYNLVKIFVTKLNIQSDFDLWQGEAKTIQNFTENVNPFKVIISPNPTFNSLISLRITEADKKSFLPYSIIVTNQTGRIVLQQKKYLSDTNIKIENLEKGVYYVEIINSEGKKITSRFIRL